MKEFTNVAGRVTSFAGRVDFFFESKVVINIDFRNGAKNQVIWTTQCKVIAKYL